MVTVLPGILVGNCVIKHALSIPSMVFNFKVAQDKNPPVEPQEHTAS